jgi:hypothetical protein
MTGERDLTAPEEFDLPEEFLEVFKIVSNMLSGHIRVDDYDAMRERLKVPLIRTVLKGTTWRHCMMLDCFQVFDMMGALTGTQPAPEWLQGNSVSGFLCPQHAWLWRDGDHLPRWRQRPEVTPARVQLHCVCGWWSGSVTHRGLARELWVGHAWEIQEEKTT